MSINNATPEDWNNLRTNHPELIKPCGPNSFIVTDEAMKAYHDIADNELEDVVNSPSHFNSGVLPTDAKERKAIPVYTGFINYFPKAIAAVAKISLVGGIQHGQTAETLHWDRSKSGDELDAMMRHILDGDWENVAWRAMANLEKKLEVSE